MSFINFDCPECGHNLEVDERGAGFIVKCPECDNPLQIPELPRSHRIRKVASTVLCALVPLFLFAACVWFWNDARGARLNTSTPSDLQTRLDQAEDLVEAKQAEINMLQGKLTAIKIPDLTALRNVALTAMDKADELARLLDQTELRFLENNAAERNSLLRAHLREVVESAKDTLPVQPVFTDAEPGKGFQGRKIVFPVLPGSDGHPLRSDAEITDVDGDTISVKFNGGTASYKLAELHPGVAAFLPIDPLLVLPAAQRPAEAARVHQTLAAKRDTELSRLRSAIEDGMTSKK